MNNRAVVGIVLSSLFLVSFTLRLPVLAAKILHNRSLIRVLRTPACDPDSYPCKLVPNPYPLMVYHGNRKELIAVRDDLFLANNIKQRSLSTQLRLAEFEFALGNRVKAAQYLSEIGKIDTGRSALLQEQRYEAQLVSAYDAFNRKDWADAVYHFRLGLSWGSESIYEEDQRIYFYSLAQNMKLHSKNQSYSFNNQYLTVKYLIEAEAFDEALLEVAELEETQKTNRLAIPKLNELKGRVSEKRGEIKEAISKYEDAIQGDRRLRIATLRLLELDKDLSNTSRENFLLQSGPYYRLGATGTGYHEFFPVTLENGWTLVGYDLDEDLLDQAHFLDIWLWWKGNGKISGGDNWIRLGNYWIHRQRIVNLFPNPGFEWDSDERGIPLGFDREFYGVEKTNFGIDTVNRNGKRSKVVYVNNNENNPDIGLISRSIQIEPDSYYLMAGWMWDQGDNGNFGRLCKPEEIDYPRQYYLADGLINKPVEKWIHLAGFSIPYSPSNTSECRTILTNNQSNQTTRWDGVLWARIDLLPKDENTD